MADALARSAVDPNRSTCSVRRRGAECEPNAFDATMPCYELASEASAGDVDLGAVLAAGIGYRTGRVGLGPEQRRELSPEAQRGASIGATSET